MIPVNKTLAPRCLDHLYTMNGCLERAWLIKAPGYQNVYQSSLHTNSSKVCLLASLDRSLGHIPRKVIDKLCLSLFLKLLGYAHQYQYHEEVERSATPPHMNHSVVIEAPTSSWPCVTLSLVTLPVHSTSLQKPLPSYIPVVVIMMSLTDSKYDQNA